MVWNAIRGRRLLLSFGPMWSPSSNMHQTVTGLLTIRQSQMSCYKTHVASSPHSRWLEAGMSIHHVKALLGHANISTTDTYLNATKVGLHEAMRRIDKGRTTSHSPCPPPSIKTLA